MRTSLFAGALLAALSVTANAQQPAPTTLNGTLNVIWGDPPRGSPVMRYVFTGEDGVSRELAVTDQVIKDAGGIMALDRKRISVDADAISTAAPSVRVRSMRAERPYGIAPSIAAAAQFTLTRPFVTILCRFADSTGAPPFPLAHYQKLTGATYPGVDHYWTEVSAGGITLTGSRVLDWKVLPQPRSHYVSDNNPDLSALFNDCVATADAEIDFSQFGGINVQFDASLGCCSWGGSHYTTLDGVTRSWPATWEASWASMGVYAHEVGHSLGLPHSGGPYGRVYDSHWDVMSSSGWYWDPVNSLSFGAQTIGYHKEILGIISGARRVTATAPKTQIALERSALPRANGNAQLIIVPLADGSFYTVESRRGGGYDAPLDSGGIIHHVVQNRFEPAQVIDPDGNGYPNDAAAVWVPGEVFRDGANHVSIAFDSVVDNTLHVTVHRNESEWLILAAGHHTHTVPYGADVLVLDSARLSTSTLLQWQAGSTKRQVQLLTPAGVGGGHVRWQRRTNGLAPGVYVDTITVIASAAISRPALLIDSLIVQSPTSNTPSMAVTRTHRSDSIFTASYGYADSVNVTFTGVTSPVTWTATSRRSTTILLLPTSRVGEGSLRWYHYAFAEPAGMYVDTIRITAPGVAGSPILIIDSLRIYDLPAITTRGFGPARKTIREGGFARDSFEVIFTGDYGRTGTWRTYVAWSQPHIANLSSAIRRGSGVVHFERYAGPRSPGIYVDSVVMTSAIPVNIPIYVDTMVVESGPLSLRVSSSSRYNSVMLGAAQSQDSVTVISEGAGAAARDWIAKANPDRIMLASRNAFTEPGRGTGSARLRWFRNLTGRGPGVYVDTIRILYVDSSASTQVIDTIVVDAMLAQVSGVSRMGYALVGTPGPRDSVQLVLSGPGSAITQWTARNKTSWLVLDAASGAGSAWLRWSRNTAALSLGTYVDTIRISVPSAAGSQPLVVDSVRVIAPVAILGDSLRKTVAIGRLYADTLRANGGTGSYSWAVTGGTLPAGLSLHSGSGIISGTATSSGHHAVTVAATSVGFTTTRAMAFNAFAPPLLQSDTTRPEGVVGVAYVDSLRASGGDGTVQWAIVSGVLPAGLGLTSSGIISGVPSASGTARFTARMTSAGLMSDTTLRLRIASALAITTPSELRAGRMGAAYADTLRATGATAPVRWTIAFSSLPEGLALDSLSGAITGIAATSGEFAFVVRARSGADELTKTITIRITRPTLAESAVIDHLLGGTPMSQDEARYLDLIGNRNSRVDVGDVRAWLRDIGRIAASPELRQLVGTPDMTGGKQEKLE